MLRALSAISLGANVLSAIKIGAIALALISVVGFTHSGCSKLMEAGYQKAEADRLEDIAQQNAAANAQLRDDVDAARAAERDWRQTAGEATAAASAAIEARREATPEKGAACTPGCVYSPSPQ